MKINKLLISLVVLISTNLLANDTVPKELIGKYSLDTTYCNQTDTGNVTVTKNSFEFYEDSCEVYKATLLPNKSYDIEAKCIMEGEPYEGEFEVKKINNEITIAEKTYKSCL